MTVKVKIERSSWGGWLVVSPRGFYACGSNRARALAIARDLRASAAVTPYGLPGPKWL